MANFSQFANKLLAFEGGFVDHPNDPGGATKFGITIFTWKKFGRDINGDGRIDVEDLKLITAKDALAIFKKRFWDRMNADKITSQPVAEIIFDHFVNATGVAIIMLQRLLNVRFGADLAVDGILGPKTLAAINRVSVNALHDAYKDLRLIYYRHRANLPTDPTWAAFFRSRKFFPSSKARVFFQGWRNRVLSFPDLKKIGLGVAVAGILVFIFRKQIFG